jgi:hypothetical protein
VPAVSEVTARTAALRTAASGWREQQSTLRGARNDLARAEGSASAAGPRVQPALAAFLDTWVEQLRAHADASERHADLLELAAADYDATDAQTRARLVDLLPWESRDALTPPGVR